MAATLDLVQPFVLRATFYRSDTIVLTNQDSGLTHPNEIVTISGGKVDKPVWQPDNTDNSMNINLLFSEGINNMLGSRIDEMGRNRARYPNTTRKIKYSHNKTHSTTRYEGISCKTILKLLRLLSEVSAWNQWNLCQC